MTKKIFKKVVIFVLALAMVLPVFAACDKEPTEVPELVGLNITGTGVNQNTTTIRMTKTTETVFGPNYGIGEDKDPEDFEQVEVERANIRLLATEVGVYLNKAKNLEGPNWVVTNSAGTDITETAKKDTTAQGTMFTFTAKGTYKVVASFKLGKVEKSSHVNVVVTDAPVYNPAELYTYNTSTGSMARDWNPHTSSGEDLTMMMQWLTTPLYDYTIDPDKLAAYNAGDKTALSIGTGHITLCEGASALPTDITASLVGKYGIKEGDSGKAWKIPLNPDLKWQNGDAITAETYLYSMQQLLNPALANFRANSYTSGTGRLVGAAEYFKGQTTNFDDVGFYIGEEEGGEEFIVFVYASPNSETNVISANASASGFLVHPATYEASLLEIGGTMVRTYHKPSHWTNTMSYGPYKLHEFADDQVITFVKNDAWHGYDDGNHVNQYQTNRIRYHIISGQTAAQVSDLMFRQGKLDVVGVSYDYKANYSPDLMLQIPADQIWRLDVITDLTSLGAITQNNSSNTTLLAIPEFRQAISMSINRRGALSDTTVADQPAFTLLSVLNYIDMSYDSELFYRAQEVAEDVILEFYNLEYGAGKQYSSRAEALSAATGFDKDRAIELFDAAYDEAVKAANGTKYFDPSKGIAINIYVPTLPANLAKGGTSALCRRIWAVTNAIEEALNLSKFKTVAGKTATVTPQGNSVPLNVYDDFETGKIEMMWASVSGGYGAVDKLGLFVGTDWEGWYNPLVLNSEVLNATIGEDTKSLWAWYQEIEKLLTLTPDKKTDETMDKLAKIAAAIELAILNHGSYIPVQQIYSVQVFSKRIITPGVPYNVFYGLGGIRLYSYTKADTAWAAEVAAAGGTINYGS